MVAMLVFAAGLLGIAAWAGRRYHASTVPSAGVRLAPQPCEVRSAPPARALEIDSTRLEEAGRQAADRLWKLAFSGPSQGQASVEVNRRVGANIVAMLEVDALKAEYFPRRPTLLPQLMQVVNDPNAASERISRMIAHDPVLTADVLRLANSNLYRRTPTPVETIPRAIAMCDLESLRGLLATAMLRPVFRATRKNFPRLPRMLWERTELATRAAELHAMETSPGDRFEAQLVVLLSALGPLVVHGAALDVYTRNPHFSPSAELCVDLISELAPKLSQRIARDWEAAPRLVAALEGSASEPLTTALRMAELIGTLAFLEAHSVISPDERNQCLVEAGVSGETVARIWAGLMAAGAS